MSGKHVFHKKDEKFTVYVDCSRYPNLTSTLDEDGRRSACPGEVVIYTCKVDTPYLQWAVETFHHIEREPILFSTERNTVGSTVISTHGLFNATVVSMNKDGWVVTSNLSILAEKMFHNKWIQCSDGYRYANESPKSVLTIGGMYILSLYALIMRTHHYCLLIIRIVISSRECKRTFSIYFLSGSPSRPRFLNYSIVSHGVDSYSVIINWKPPEDSGGVRITNYTTTLVTMHKMHVYTERNTFLNIQLSYNQMYWFHVVASTCVNTSATTTMEVYESKFTVSTQV